MCNTLPLAYPGVVCIHDTFYRTHRNFFLSNLRGRLSSRWHCLHYWWAARWARRILTVSEFSKEELIRTYGVPASRVFVIGNGWEHIGDICQDDGIFVRLGLSPDRPYFFTLGNIARYKNLRWVLAAARQHPEQLFVIAGRIMRSSWTKQDRETNPRNVVFAGAVSDGEMKSLLRHCRALLHPSLLEGFGITPLEALSLGRPVVIARRTALPEVFGAAAHYIENPEDYARADPESLLSGCVGPSKPVLDRWSWRRALERTMEALGCRNMV